MKVEKKFEDKLKTDQGFRTNMAALVAAGNVDDLHAFMKRSGFTDDDIAGLDAQDLWVHSSTVDKELTNAELESVSAAGFNWCNGMKIMMDSI